MTPDSLINHIPKLLSALSPPTLKSQLGNPAALYRWLYQLAQIDVTPAVKPALGPLWPLPPEIQANQYSLADAPQIPQLIIGSSCTVHLTRTPGINPNKLPLPALEKCQRLAQHVIACSGEVAFARTDFIIPGPLEFYWQRHYRHSNKEDIGLGVGWRHSLSEQLTVIDNTVELHTAEGRLIQFELPAIGHSCYNRHERLLLQRQSLHSYRITGFDRAHKIFRADGISNALPLVEIRDNCSNSLTIDYRQGLPVKLVSSWGRVVDIHCRNSHIEQLVNAQVQDDQQPLCCYQYHSQAESSSEPKPQFLAQGTAGLNKERYHYEDKLLATLSNDASGQFKFHYDSQLRCHKLQHNQCIYTLSWRASQRRCTLNSPHRHPIHWTFNESGQLLSERQQKRTTSYYFDLYGNLCQATATDGQRTLYRHDALGRLTRRTHNGSGDRHLYDQNNLLCASQLQGDQLWRFTCNDQGLPLRISDPANQEWQCQYSDRGQLIQITDPEQGQVALSWDSQGQLQSLQRGDQQWVFEYNHWQQLTALIVNGETVRQWRYGPSGALCHTQIGEYCYQLDYDTQARPCAIHVSNHRTSTDQSLHWRCNLAGQPKLVRFADGQEWLFTYNAHQQLTQLDSAQGNTFWHYDLFGQLSSCENTSNLHWQWQYTLNGALSEYRDNDAHWYFHYARTGAIEQIRNNSGQNSAFHYDAHQRLTQASNAQSTLRFQYDQRNRLIAEHHHSANADNISLQYQYDARGWLKKSSSENLVQNYCFAPSGALFSLDANGEAALRCHSKQQLSEQTQGGLQSFSQYQAGQLANLESNQELSWQFPPKEPLTLSNPLPQQQILAIAIERDARGHIFRELRPLKRQNIKLGNTKKNHQAYRYLYDGWGLLKSAECGNFKTYFHYDPFGRRLSKLSTHRKSTRQRRIQHTWCTLGLWHEIQFVNGKVQLSVNFLHHPVLQTLLCRWQAEKMQHYLVDPQGKPLALFDHQGQLLWQTEFTTEGVTKGITRGKSNRDSWRGKGQLYDSETGLFYSGHGYWHPLLKTYLKSAQCS